MGFENVYVTKLGLQLEAKSRVGKNIKILRVDIGDGELTDNNITEKTSLIHKILECEINNLQEIDSQTIINFILQQSKIDEGFYFREFGVIAEEPDTKEEVLYMYANAKSKAEFVNDKTSTAINDRIIDIVIKEDNTDNISISIDNTGVYIEREEYLKKISDLQNNISNIDERVNAKSEELKTDYTNKINNLRQIVVASNAGAHNAIYRGEDITDLFYDGTLSQQIANGTFDDIFIGDYIIGQTSGRKYLVADINYRLNTGDTECTTYHILMIPEKIIYEARMNESEVSIRAYAESKMHADLQSATTIIKRDFGTSHILKHRNYFRRNVDSQKVTDYDLFDSEVDLMNEAMVCGSYILENSSSENYTIDTSQISLFKFRHDLIIALNDSDSRYPYWLRDLISPTTYAYVETDGRILHVNETRLYGVRPAFLIY